MACRTFLHLQTDRVELPKCHVKLRGSHQTDHMTCACNGVRACVCVCVIACQRQSACVPDGLAKALTQRRCGLHYSAGVVKVLKRCLTGEARVLTGPVQVRDKGTY